MNFARIAQLIPYIMMAVEAVEAFKTDIHGPEKKRAALDLILGMLPAIEGLAGRDLVNDADLLAGLGMIIDGVVMTMDAVDV